MKSLLLAMKGYIEQAEISFDGDHGSGRPLNKIIADGDMPELYHIITKELRKLDNQSHSLINIRK